MTNLRHENGLVSICHDDFILMRTGMPSELGDYSGFTIPQWNDAKLQNNLHYLWIHVRPHPFVCHHTITSIQLSLPSSQLSLPSIQVKRLINCAYFSLVKYFSLIHPSSTMFKFSFSAFSTWTYPNTRFYSSDNVQAQLRSSLVQFLNVESH